MQQKLLAIKEQEEEQGNLLLNMVNLDPTNVHALKEYAKFSRDIAKDQTLAMEIYQKALVLSPGEKAIHLKF